MLVTIAAATWTDFNVNALHIKSWAVIVCAVLILVGIAPRIKKQKLGLRSNVNWGYGVNEWMNGWYKRHRCMISMFLVIWSVQSKYLQSSRSNAAGSTKEIYDNTISSEDESIRLWMHGSMGVWALDGRWILVDENNSCHKWEQETKARSRTSNLLP